MSGNGFPLEIINRAKSDFLLWAESGKIAPCGSPRTQQQITNGTNLRARRSNELLPHRPGRHNLRTEFLECEKRI
jgi:hypothetical protein